MAIINFFNRVIEYSFYGLFFLVPLFFTSNTFELFEFNKMWLTFGIALIIAGAWFSKMILQRRILIQRTPLDIPIILFLLSQIIATIFSLDPHVSLWGYYSRFNGGLLSIISYIFLYYAFVSNFVNEEAGGRSLRAPDSAHALSQKDTSGALAGKKLLTGPAMVKRLLFVSLASGLIVALWGLPSHFGYDPTCLLFRGTFDVSCWTEAFQPKVRIFSTLGQPNWLAAYLAILIPIAIASGMQKAISNKQQEKRKIILIAFPLLLISLFYVALLFSGSRSGFYGLIVGLLVFFALKRNILAFIPFIVVFVIASLVFGTPSTPKLTDYLSKLNQVDDVKKQESKPLGPALETGGTESGNIRLIVWKGAIEAFKNNPLIGTGVETFAFAYYKHRPPEHNLTSEWDFLYNKAHNEYLNYLTTTGASGLGTYLVMIGWFLTNVIPNLFRDLRSSGNKMLKRVQHDSDKNITLHFALIGSYVSILVSNFLGFSVVIVNLYLFLIPAFVLTLTGSIKQEKNLKSSIINHTSIYQWFTVVLLLFAIFYLLFSLLKFWRADTHYALGYNLDRAREYQLAYPSLLAAAELRGNEPVFLDEFSFNSAMLSVIALAQQDATASALFAQNALKVSDKVTSEHPNNIVFFKTRARILYALSQINPDYTSLALEAIQKANKLAPTDAKVSYNLGVLYGQSGDVKKAVSVLEQTVKLKPDYRDAYYALALFYHELGDDKKAVSAINYILNNLNPEDSEAKSALKNWGL